MDPTLDTLLADISKALRLKERAERSRVNAEARKKKAHYAYLQLMDTFHAREYTLS